MLRLEYRTKRAQLPSEEKLASDLQITRLVLENKAYDEAQELLCYVSTADEVDTRAIISDAFARGKSVFVPKCMEQRGVMNFYRIRSFDDLSLGKYGIPEPMNIQPDNQWQPSGNNAVCIVPALCCDERGNRLGYGGGYYAAHWRESYSGKRRH